MTAAPAPNDSLVVSIAHDFIDDPRPRRRIATIVERHSEFFKFALVGGITWVVDTTVFILLGSTVLQAKPVTAKIVAVLVATCVSYVLSRSWSFRPRRQLPEFRQGYRFLSVSLLAVGLYAAPLWISRYVLDLKQPAVGLATQHIADFVSGQIIGVLLGMAFRWWAFRRFVFPGEPATSIPAAARTRLSWRRAMRPADGELVA